MKVDRQKETPEAGRRAGAEDSRDSAKSTVRPLQSQQRFVVKVSAEQANGRNRIKTWSSYASALEAEQAAARLRSFGWNAWAEDDLRAEQAAKASQ